MHRAPTTRVYVGLSGGVDSAVAALLLKRRGYDVHALFMKNWDEDDAHGQCPAARDLADAKAVCETLSIPLHTVSFSTEYWDRVFSYFLKEHASGRTPNPDVLCNREIKFRAFLDYATGLGADFIATGHYARLATAAGLVRLRKAADMSKDQTYFLHTLDQGQLTRSIFPVGDLLKMQVRHIAREAGLDNFAKKDSTGICFIGERRFSEFLGRYLPGNPGEIHTLDEQVLGTHKGLMFYTIGQRHGLGIGGRAGAPGQPWYVAGKDLEKNILRVVQGEHHPALYSRALNASRLHWVSGSPPPLPFNCSAKIRYRQADQRCSIVTIDGDRCTAIFDLPQRAVTPGQSVVFYRHDECLGGGIIDEGVQTVKFGSLKTAIKCTP
jgi:tRNA-specific 2-thiouridylase